MKKQWIVALGILALLFSLGGTAGATNFADDDCGNPDSTIDTAAEAVRVANGYDCPGVDLVIKTNLNDNAPSDIVDHVLSITAKSIKIEGPGVEIINDNPASEVRMIAANGDIIIKDATIKARDNLVIRCDNPAACKVDIDDSEIIASLNLDTVSGGGTLRITGQGDVTIDNTTTYAGDILHIVSTKGMVRWFCPVTGGGCKDPNVSNRAVELCGVPPGTPPAVFPCTVTFLLAKDLKDVCFPGVSVTCGGANKEMGIDAKLDVDIRGSTINALSHLNITSFTGSILAGPVGGSKTDLTVATGMNMTAKKTIELMEATIDVGTSLNVKADCAGVPVGVCCINAVKSDIEAKDIRMTANNGAGLICLCEATLNDIGADLPTLNGDSTAPFGPNVDEDAVECAVAAIIS